MVEVFPSQLIISNPGGLVKWLKPDDFGKISKTRNSIIASLLVRTSFVEKMGTGIKRIRDAMADSKLPAPEFIDREYYFYLTLRDEKGVQESSSKLGEKLGE